MAKLKGTKTQQNLKDAFAGESQANRRYLYFAKVADVEGYPQIAGNFRETAEGETGHAHGHLDYLKAVGDPATDLPIGDTVKNLKELKAALGHLLPDALAASIERDQKERATMSILLPPQMLNTMNVEDLWSAIVAATEGWRPELVLVSAGFDAMAGDPLGGFTLEPGHYRDLTIRLRDRLAGVPVVGLLEGGYVPTRLAEGVLAHLAALDG